MLLRRDSSQFQQNQERMVRNEARPEALPTGEGLVAPSLIKSMYPKDINIKLFVQEFEIMPLVWIDCIEYMH